MVPNNLAYWFKQLILLLSLVLTLSKAPVLTAAAQQNVLAVGVTSCFADHDSCERRIDNFTRLSMNQIGRLSSRRELTLAMRWFYYKGNWGRVIELGEGFYPMGPLQAFFLGQALRHVGEMDEAVQTWRDHPQIASELTWECTKSLNTSECESALEACRMATEVNPHLGIAYAELGRVNTYCYRRFEDAIRAYERAIELKGDDSKMWLAMAHTMDMQGLSVQAAQIIADHYLSGPLADAIHGNALRSQGRLLGALHMYQRAVSQDGNNADFHHVRAEIYLELGDKQNAAIAWRRALEIDPSFQPALLGLRSLEGK